MKKFFVLIVFCAVCAVSVNSQVVVFNNYFFKYPVWCQELEDAAQTDPLAQVVVGSYYLNGDGVDKNYEKAVYWLTKSLTPDNDDIARAYNNLGYCYEHGYGCSMDFDKAFSFYQKAAYKGEMSAIVNLAECYELGKGTEINNDSALIWYEKGIKYGKLKRKAKVRYGYIVAFIKDDAKKGMEYLNEAAKEGSGTALFYLGKIYDFGIGGIPKDDLKAVQYYKESIETETIPFALTHLANHYYEGTGIQKNVEKAIELYQDAARMGDDEAKEQLKKLGINVSIR